MSNRKEIIKQKLAQKTELINLKKATVKNTDGIICNPKLFVPEGVNKSELPKDTDEVIYRSIIGNTYNLMDSHEDVHLNGCFTKSVQENKRQLYQMDHNISLKYQAGKVLKAYQQLGSFKDFGFDSDKETEAFMKDVSIYKEQNKQFFSQMKNGQITQHSVGMMYVKIELAVDDVTAEEEYKRYTQLLPKIGNFEEVEKKGYFFAVYEAKELETSAVTLASNPVTGVYNDNKEEMTEEKMIELFANTNNIDEIYQKYVKTRTNEAVNSDTSLADKSFIDKINIY